MHGPAQVATPLSEVLARGPVPVATLARWGAQLARALAAAHAAGSSHGDVRASVVTVRPDGSVHLGGFGLPRAERPAHPAPEWTPESWPSPAADVYALGALLHGAGAGVEPGLADLWAWTGDSEPTRRPSAAQLAARLDRFADAADPAGRPDTNRRKLVVFLVVVGALVAGALVGSGTWLLIRPHPNETTWANPMAEVRTADPCALVDATEMQRFGSTRLYPDRNVVTACTLYILPGSGPGSWLTVAITGPMKDEKDLAELAHQRVGQMTVYEEPSGPRYCSRVGLLPDRSRVYLRMDGEGSTSSLDACTADDAAVRIAARALDGPTLPRRPIAGPPNSLVWLDACNLGDERTLRSLPGLNVNLRERSYGGWGCSWGYDGALANPPPYVRFLVMRDEPLSGETKVIGGRTATVVPSGDTTCVVRIAQRSYQGVFDQPRVETLYVNVFLPLAQPGVACSAATSLAEAASAKLPPPG
ncbi:hypothetical protein [Pseudonocardia acaciae]|uniref:hypothetical protein n=1 Tax=Pseudonocardia acaciae TaxID=551276 RepID=UPI000491AD8D|nr:hypothetical protein [Pseudonocardia acaciae]